MKRAVIFDLDNCLADDEPRIPLIDWTELVPFKRYARYHMECGEDRHGNIDVFRVWAATHTPLFLTGRPVAVRAKTMDWIRDKLNVHRPILLMRNNSDDRPSVQVKRDMLGVLPEYGFYLNEVSAAFDDRLDILSMYQDAGLAAWQLCIHDVDAYTPPRCSL